MSSTWHNHSGATNSAQGYGLLAFEVGASSTSVAVLASIAFALLARDALGAPWLAGAGGLALAAFGLIAAAAAVLAHQHIPGRRFGAANHLTLARGALASVLVVLAVHPLSSPADLGWTCTVFATAALLLDLADGAVARRTGNVSRFGARFDMEMDTLLAIALSVLVVRAGITGPWLLAGGLARYLFTAAQWAAPRLRGGLPFSQRRRVLCATYGIVLTASLAPPLGGVASASACLVALALLLASFAADIFWLYSNSRPPASATNSHGAFD